MSKLIPRNLGMDLVRATEMAAILAGRWMGLGDPDHADREAMRSMHQGLCGLGSACCIVVGEENTIHNESPLQTGCIVGHGHIPEHDLVVDPIDGRQLLAQGRAGAISVAAVAPRGSMWSPKSAIYMDKIVVNREVASALVPECLDAPIGWTLALVARVKNKSVRDLTVFILDRPRHFRLVDEVRTAGSRVMLRSDGDISGALMAATPGNHVDILLGIGGVAEGIISACAVKALGGAMLARLAPQDETEYQAIHEAGFSTEQILNCDGLVSSEHIFFSATGITDGPLLSGVRYRSNLAETQTLLLRGDSGTRRIINAEHLFSDLNLDQPI